MFDLFSFLYGALTTGVMVLIIWIVRDRFKKKEELEEIPEDTTQEIKENIILGLCQI